MPAQAENGRFPSELLQSCLNIWSNGQVNLTKVIRWGMYVKEFADLRRQNCLQHTHSICSFADISLIMFEEYVELDKPLVLRAFQIHDIGEGILGRDLPYSVKKENNDLEEYRAFCREYENLPRRVFDSYHRAFLLQFCLKNPESFPPEARTIMAELAETKKYEALFFSAIEHWDYFLFGLEHYQRTGNGYVLHVVIHSNLKLFDGLAEELPGFKDLFWNNKVRDWCNNFYNQHDKCPCGGYAS